MAARLPGQFQERPVTEFPEPVVEMGAPDPPFLLIQEFPDKLRKVPPRLQVFPAQGSAFQEKVPPLFSVLEVGRVDHGKVALEEGVVSGLNVAPDHAGEFGKRE